ncbi:hypothetical protein [Aquabacterium sp.]|uniref:hypothetical protein n=1 Tax=Aquabacterium sp. TaxID=1872578 RepID=UPI003B6C8EE7
MGQEIHASHFSEQDQARFDSALAAETRLARTLFQQGGFARTGMTAGYELEAWLLDRNFYPKPCNQRFLQALASPLVVPELSRFNIELNGLPQPLTGRGLSHMAQALAETWSACAHTAHADGGSVLAIGTLPTLREVDLNLASMTPASRYRALNERVLRARGGRPLTLKIEGLTQLDTTHRDVMLEAGTTSFQLHLQAPAQHMHRYLNAATLLSGPLIALSANSPFLFGQALWHETRIPLFEQAVACGDDDAGHRVTFGHGYVGPDVTELFDDNLLRYPVLLPLCSDAPLDDFAHLRLHNGTVWRWNRLLIGWDAQQQPHLRLEQRVMPAGPSLIDMWANAAFFYGAVHMLATQPLPPERLVPFDTARTNFYTAAREGLQAPQTWLDGKVWSAQELLTQLLPLAREGLNRLGIAATDIDRYLDVVTLRLRTGQNGAAWQLAHHARHHDLFKLTADYLAHQRSGAPVHEWPL